MNRYSSRVFITAILAIFLIKGDLMSATDDVKAIELPAPEAKGGMPVETALANRRSARRFSDAALTLSQVGQLLWAAQGISDPRGYRTAPSAGALYPLEVYIVAGKTEDLPAGVYRYLPVNHQLQMTASGDLRDDLSGAALNQSSVKNAPGVIVICAVYERVTGKYRERGVRYVHMEAGHAGQNIALQAVSLGLGTVPVGAFRDDAVKKIIAAGQNEVPLYLIPVGEPRE